MRKILSLLLVTAMLATNAGASNTFTTNYNLTKPSDGSTSWGADLRGDLDSIDSQMFINAGSISSHISNATAAHAGTAISATSGATVCTASTNVQAYLDCLDTNLGTVTGGAVMTTNTAQTVTGAKNFSTTPRLSALGTGLIHSDASGNLSSSLVVDADITGNTITNASLAQMSAHTFKGNNSGSTANASDLNATQLTAELNAFVGDSGAGGTKGVVPAPAAGDAAASKFLKADGTWSTTPGGGSGTVTSVDLAVPAEFSVSGNPVTTSGTITIAKVSQTQNKVFASPNGSSGVATFRALVSADIPTLNQNTTGSSGSVSGTNVVTRANLTQVAAHSYLGNNTGSTANVADITSTQLTADLNAMVGDSGSGGTKGLVPAPSAGDAAAGKFLKADGTFAVPSGGGGGTTAKFVLEGAVIPYTNINAGHVQTSTQSLTAVNIGMLNSGTSGSTTIQVNQYRSGALQGSATASLSASSGNPATSVGASLSGTLSLQSGDLITVDVNSVAGGTPESLTVEY